MRLLTRKSLILACLALTVTIVLLPAAQRENSSERAGTSFPSDTRLPGQSKMQTLLGAICHGNAADCQESCPGYTGFGRAKINLRWKITGVTMGHFLSAASDDAAVSVSGCEPHSMNFGGTVLLTKRADRWSMVWYKAGVDTSRCHKVSLKDHREILACIGQYGAQGNVWTSLYVEDLRSPKPVLMAGDNGFFTAYDNTLTCGQSGSRTFPLIRSHIRRVEFGRVAGSGPAPILVDASVGKKASTPASVRACMNHQEENLPATRDYQIKFIFSGHGYKPAPSSARNAQIFAQQDTNR